MEGLHRGCNSAKPCLLLLRIVNRKQGLPIVKHENGMVFIVRFYFKTVLNNILKKMLIQSSD